MFRAAARIRQLPLSKGFLNRSFRHAAPRMVVQSNPEIYTGYNPNRTLEDVDMYASTSPRKPEVPSDYQLYGHHQFPFKNFLSSPDFLHNTVEGAYVPVSDDDMAKYLPDAVMGEVSQEFAYSETKAWMIRDSTRLLCRIIEEYEKNKAVVAPPSKDGEADVMPQALSLKAQLEGLTDRPERSDGLLKVYRRAKLISDKVRPNVGNFDIMSGQGSLVENVLDEVKKGDQWNRPELPTQILVTGDRGTGKSFTLNQTVLYARKRNWLVMVVDGWRQAQYGWFIEPFKFRDQVPDTENLYDNSFMSAEMLRNFYRAHKDTLHTIPIENADTVLAKYQHDLAKFREEWDRSVLLAPPKAKFIEIRRMVEGEDNFEEEDALDEDILGNYAYPKVEFKSLGDLVLLGLFYRDFAGAAAIDLIDQLKNLESHRVMFAVDGYNSWEIPSVYQYENKKVMSKQLCVPYALNFLSRHKEEQAQWKLKNGIAIGFTSHKHPPQLKDVYHDALKSFFFVMKMPVYSSSEYLAAMRLYLENSGLFEKDGVSTQELVAFRSLCDSNPRLVRTESFGFFAPFSSQRLADTEDPFDDSFLDDVDIQKSSGSRRKGDRGADDDDDGYGEGFDEIDLGMGKEEDDYADEDIADEDVKF